MTKTSRQQPNSVLPLTTTTSRPRFLPPLTTTISSSHWSSPSSFFQLLLLFSGILTSSASFHNNYNCGLDFRKDVMIQPSTASSSCLFARKKHGGSKKSKNNNNNNKHTRSTPISEDELVRHVTSQYITGVGGVLYKAMARSSKDLRSDDHAKLMQSLNRHPALVLNADYQPISYLPLSMWHWQEAVKSVFTGKVTVVDTYPNIVIHTASLEIPLPSVIALNEYVPPASKAKPAFTKRNVFLRDEYKCQYCNDRFTTNDLSLDHVVPRCRGGRLDWTNAVTCCRRCNGKKGSLSIKQLRSVGMKLVREPSVPTQFQLHAIAGRMLPRKVHPSWAPFLGLDNNDDDDDEKAMASEGLSKGYFEEVAYHAKYR